MLCKNSKTALFIVFASNILFFVSFIFMAFILGKDSNTVNTFKEVFTAYLLISCVLGGAYSIWQQIKSEKKG